MTASPVHAGRLLRTIARKVYRALPFKQPLFEGLRKVAPLPEPLYRHLHFRGAIRIPVEDTSFRMWHHGYQIENELFWSGVYGGWEGASLRVWVRAARHAGTVFDVGANTGLYALVAKAVAPRATVAAFEPSGRVHARLEANVRLNGFELVAHRLALSDRDGTTSMMDSLGEHELSATLELDSGLMGGRPLRRVPVTVARLDSLMASGRVPPPDLVKIDVEGHEAAVLAGMADQLRERRPTLLVEVLTEAAAAGVRSLTEPLAYRIFRLDRDGPRACDRVEAAPTANLILCRPELCGPLGLTP